MYAVATGAALAILIVMQWFLVLECLKMKTTVGEHSSSLKDEMGHLGKLLDEALDFIADNMPSPQLMQAVTTQPAMDFKEAILGALISRMNMGAADGSKTQSQEWQIYEDNTQTVEEEDLQRDESSRDSISG